MGNSPLICNQISFKINIKKLPLRSTSPILASTVVIIFSFLLCLSVGTVTCTVKCTKGYMKGGSFRLLLVCFLEQANRFFIIVYCLHGPMLFTRFSSAYQLRFFKEKKQAVEAVKQRVKLETRGILNSMKRWIFLLDGEWDICLPGLLLQQHMATLGRLRPCDWLQ